MKPQFVYSLHRQILILVLLSYWNIRNRRTPSSALLEFAHYKPVFSHGAKHIRKQSYNSASFSPHCTAVWYCYGWTLIFYSFGPRDLGDVSNEGQDTPAVDCAELWVRAKRKLGPTLTVLSTVRPLEPARIDDNTYSPNSSQFEQIWLFSPLRTSNEGRQDEGDCLPLKPNSACEVAAYGVTRYSPTNTQAKSTPAFRNSWDKLYLGTARLPRSAKVLARTERSESPRSTCHVDRVIVSHVIWDGRYSQWQYVRNLSFRSRFNCYYLNSN